MTDEGFPYRDNRWSAGNPDQAKLWFDELERTGTENVRAKLALTSAGAGANIPIGAAQMTMGFAEEWLAWHDRRKSEKEAAFRSTQIYWTRWAAVAASFAATAAVFGWLITLLTRHP
jgi:hypothetical protein